MSFMLRNIYPKSLLLVLASSLTACFETLEKQEKIKSSNGSIYRMVEDEFSQEIAMLEELSLDGSSLSGLWIAFYTKELPDNDSLEAGISAWTLFEVSHQAESTNFTITGLNDCSSHDLESFQYSINQSVIASSYFSIEGSSSYLFPPTQDIVQVTINNSGRELNFSDYVSADDDESLTRMSAYKLSDSNERYFGSVELSDGRTYEVSCLAYSKKWSLTELNGDDLRRSEVALLGFGNESMFLTAKAVLEEYESDSPEGVTIGTEFVSFEISIEEASEIFSTEDSEAGAKSTGTYTEDVDLVFSLDVSRSDGLEGAVELDLNTF